MSIVMQEMMHGILGVLARNNAVRLVVLYLVFYFGRCVRKPDVFYGGERVGSVYKMNSLHKSYYPLIIAPFGVVQTVLQLFRRPAIHPRTMVVIEAVNNGSIVLDIAEKNKETQKNVLLVHGFNGSGDSTYMQWMSAHLVREGYRVFCFNARGTKSGLKNAVFFHIGWTVDLKEAVRFVLENYSGTLEVFGFSMGANWVTKLFGEGGLDPRVVKGGAVCLPFDFFKIGGHFQKNPYTRFFNWILAKNFIKYMKRNRDAFKNAGYDFETVKKCRSMQQIDMLVTKNIFGIDDVDHYYRSESGGNYIHTISVPFIILNTYDDPVVPAFSIDKDACMKNGNILLVITHKGGHLGFLSNMPSRTLAEDILIDFIRHF